MITTDRDDRSLFVRMTGVADLRAARPLADFLIGLHRDSVRHGVTEATVDLREVEFMSAPCFRGFVAWVGEIQREGADRQYRLAFIRSGERQWQQRTLHALVALAPALVSVEP